MAAGSLPSWGLSQLTSTCLAPSWWTWSRGRWTACARVPSATSSALTTSSSVGPRGGRGAQSPDVPLSSCIPGPARPVAIPGALGGRTPPAPRGPALPAHRQTSAVPASHPAPASDLAAAAGGSGWSSPDPPVPSGCGRGGPAAIEASFLSQGRAVPGTTGQRGTTRRGPSWWTRCWMWCGRSVRTATACRASS